MNAKELKAGYVFTAIVKRVRDEGVYVEMPMGKGSASISTRCWGRGVERAHALAKISPGDKLEVVVRGYDPHTCTLSLALAGREKLSSSAKDVGNGVRKAREAIRRVLRKVQRVCQRKPDHKLLPKGSVVLVDASNLLGYAGPSHAADVLGGISSALAEQECKCLHFMEHRCYIWARRNQHSEADVDALDDFVKRDDVVLISGGRDEADAHVLQYAETLPGSIIWTKDKFSDHAKAHPAIVGSDRIIEFNCKQFDGKLFITATGLARAIVIEPKSAAAEQLREVRCVAAQVATAASGHEVREPEPAVCQPEVEERKPERQEPVVSCEEGYARTASRLLAHGEYDRAVRYLGRIAKTNPGACFELADIVCDGKDMTVDNKKVLRYERLARKTEKRARERDLRDRRRRAESFRSGFANNCHFYSARVDLHKEGRKVIRECCTRVNRPVRHVFGRAA